MTSHSSYSSHRANFNKVPVTRARLCKWWEQPVHASSLAQDGGPGSTPKTRAQVMRELEQARASGKYACLVNVHGD